MKIDISTIDEYDDLKSFYNGIYTETFPSDDERESLEHIVDYLQKSKETTDWKFHVLLAKDNENIIGGIVFDYFAKTNSTMIEFIVVNSSYRGSGIGTELLDNALRISDEDAKIYGNNSVEFIFCEIESPEISRDKHLSHMRFWNAVGMRKLDFEYVQPALSSEQNPVCGLWLVAKYRNNLYVNIIDSHIVEQVIFDYTFYSMKIKYPYANQIFSKMCKELRMKQNVNMLEFFDED